jgi:hypothetical protein
MNDLEKYFWSNDKRLIDKWLHYFEVYDLYFNRFRGRELTILEIGVSHGGSLQMWKDYFGAQVKVYGIDIDPRCKQLEEQNIEIFIGSQSDRDFLREVKEKIPPVDILIDDGGHTMDQQIVTFEELFDHIKDDGIYLCEDLHTSYWIKFGGGHKRAGTFIEYSKNFIDLLNAHHSEQSALAVDDFTRKAFSVHFYDSVLVILKRNMQKPRREITGVPSFEYVIASPNFFQKMSSFLILKLNIFLRFFKIRGVILR